MTPAITHNRFIRDRDAEAIYVAPDRYPWCHPCPKCGAPARVLCHHFRSKDEPTIHRTVCRERY